MLTLAMLAVAMKVMIPPGFMTASPTNDLPFALVMCTGQGEIVVNPGEALPEHGKGDRAPANPAHDSPCVFAGHGVAAPPSLAYDSVIAFVAYDYRPQPAQADLAPGRGLTGPPLPARGPPSLLI